MEDSEIVKLGIIFQGNLCNVGMLVLDEFRLLHFIM